MPPLLIAAAIAAAATAAAAGGGAASGIGKDTTKSPSFGETPFYDPNKFRYGGTQGKALMDASRYQRQAEEAQQRGAPQANFSGAQPDYNSTRRWEDLAGTTRGQQGAAAGLMMDRATGVAPSIAQQQADRQMQQAQAAQASQLASARGAGGLALAQQNAANNVAGMQGQISGQAQINAAQERMQAEQAAYNAFSGMRQGDTSAANDQAQRAQFNAGLLTDQQKYNAGLQIQQRTLNDQMTGAMTGYERGVRSDELQGGIAQQRALAGSVDTQGQEHAQEGRDNANRQMDWFKMGIGGFSGAAQAGSAGGAMAKADGGPVKKGGLYLVGERGPELMVAPSDGHIVPNHMIRGLY